MLYIFLIYFLLILHQFVLKLISQLSHLYPSFVYLMLQQTRSRVGLELRTNVPVIISLRGCSCSYCKQVRDTLPCMCCLPFGSNGGWFTFMAQGEKNTGILLNWITYSKFQCAFWKIIIHFSFNLKTPHACGFTYRCWHFPEEIPFIQKWLL